MSLETNKLKMYSFLISILRLREQTLKSPELISNNQDFVESLRKNYIFMKKELIEYLYCYIYANFNEMSRSTLEIDPETDFVRIRTFPKRFDEGEEEYKEAIIETIEDEVLPIKVRNQVVKVLNGEENARISNSIVFANSKAIEMIKIKSSESRTDLFGIPLNDLFERAAEVPKQKVLYRDEGALGEVTEMKADGSELNTYYIDAKRDIFSIEPRLDNNDRFKGISPTLIKEAMPATVLDYITRLSRRKGIEYSNKKKLINNDKVDKDIMSFLRKVESSGRNVDEDVPEFNIQAFQSEPRNQNYL